MAQLLNPFDATQWNPAQSSGQLPIGNKQVAQIIASEVKANLANDGGFLEFILEILDGPNVGSTGAYRLNLYNQSQKAVEIANRQLSSVCHVVNTFQLGADGRDTSVLHLKPFRIDVGYQKGQDPATNPEANGYTEVKKVYDINGNEPGKAPAAPQAVPPVQTAAPTPAPAPAVQPVVAPAPWAGGQTAPAAPVQQQTTPAPAAAPPWGQPTGPASQPPASLTTAAPAPPWGAPQ